MQYDRSPEELDCTSSVRGWVTLLNKGFTCIRGKGDFNLYVNIKVFGLVSEKPPLTVQCSFYGLNDSLMIMSSHFSYFNDGVYCFIETISYMHKCCLELFK